MDRRYGRALFFTVICLVAVDAVFFQDAACAAEQSVKQQYLQYAEKMRKEQAKNRDGVEKAIVKYVGEGKKSDNKNNNVEEKKEKVHVKDSVIASKYERFDMEQAYQVNRLKNFLVTEYKKNGFESCITDEVLWKVPYETEIGEYGLAIFGKGQENSDFEYYGASVKNEPGQMEAMPPTEEEIAGNFQEAAPDEKIQKVQYTYYNGLTLIYIKTIQMEYVIPYAENASAFQGRNPDSKLHNGNVYEMGKFMKEMEKISDEKEMLEGDGDLNYGTAFHHGLAGITLQGVIAAILLAVVVGVTAAIVGKKRKNAGKV